MKIAEFFAELGVKTDTKNLKDFAKTIGNIPLDIGVAIAALAGIEYELTKVASRAMEAAIGFQMFGAQTGLNWRELQRWQIVAEQANVSAETVTSSITALESHLAQIRMGYGNTRPFAMFGIDINQNAFGVLSQLRRAIGKYPTSVSRNLLGEMGIGPDMMRMLELSDREWQKYVEHVHGMTDQQYKDFIKLKLTFVEVGQTVRYWLIGLVDHFINLAERITNFKKILLTIGIVLAGVAVAMSPMTAAIIGLILILDDLATYFTGGQSVFGLAMDGIDKLIKKFGEFEHLHLPDWLEKFMMNVGSALVGTQGPSVMTGYNGSTTATNTFNINVNASGDPDAIAKAVWQALKKPVGVAEAHFKNKAQ